MPKVIVQNDEGREVWSMDYPDRALYAAWLYMPSCPSNTTVHSLLMGLKRGLTDAGRNHGA